MLFKYSIIHSFPNYARAQSILEHTFDGLEDAPIFSVSTGKSNVICFGSLIEVPNISPKQPFLNSWTHLLSMLGSNRTTSILWLVLSLEMEETNGFFTPVRSSLRSKFGFDDP